jgi:acyl-CoA hydrolase
MMKPKTPSASLAVTTKVVLPNETNTLGKLFGGALLAWMDEIAAVSAYRHSNTNVVTASVSNVSFNHPVDLGAVVTLEAKVSRAFTSSMEVIIDVSIEDRKTGEKKASNQAIYTFVAVDENGNKVQVAEITPETEEEKKRFNAAKRRRELSLILAGKMKPSAAVELKALFAD